MPREINGTVMLQGRRELCRRMVAELPEECLLILLTALVWLVHLFRTPSITIAVY